MATDSRGTMASGTSVAARNSIRFGSNPDGRAIEGVFHLRFDLLPEPH